MSNMETNLIDNCMRLDKGFVWSKQQKQFRPIGYDE